VESTIDALSRVAHCEECSLPLDEHRPIQVGTLLDGRYRVEGVHGTGGMGSVLRARDVHLERKVAIKVVREMLAGQPAYAQRFQREAATMARLQSPHLATVYGFGVHGDTVFFVMESVSGATLAEVLAGYSRAKAHLPVARAVQIVSAVAEALSVSHGTGIVHRDIKAENVLVEADTGRVVLVDFGVAFQHGVDQSDGRLWGTPQYLAPELVDDPTPTPATDQYALGILTYEIFTGDVPFDGRDPWEVVMAHKTRPVPRLSVRREDLGSFDGVLERVLKKKPEERYPTCLAFARALEEAHRIPSSHPPAPESETIALADGALRVLVVDDDPLFAKMAQRCVQVAFAGVPIAVSKATSAMVALEKCQRGMPDLVVLDYMMPEMDGVELLTRIRALPGGRRPRAVVVSGSVESEARWRFSALGVRTFAKKPIDFPELTGVIHSLAEQNGWIQPAGEGA
jgi:serine/threonine-protein kinase